uniref:Uncharacterized protein n=2 Tax=Meloidogyne enterolobii TaxID=390850 RepID=A0A6V7TXZ5_MELEN|nr:unnamed protein product [Meloidogyne enterolobii]
MISLGDIGGFNKIPRKSIKREGKKFDFPLPEELEEKFKNGFKKPIPLVLSCRGAEDEGIPLILKKVFTERLFASTFHNIFPGIDPSDHLPQVEKTERYTLHLPPMIKSKEDIEIVYYYLSKLFKCIFKCSYFEDYIINPELIKLLFGEAKQFYVQNCNISTQDYNVGILLQFVLNNLASENHQRIFHPLGDDTMKKYKDDLYKILLYGGDKFGKIYVMFHSSPKFYKKFYKHIVEHVATSKKISKMVPHIILHFSHCPSLKLPEKAKNVEIKKLNDEKSTTFKIVNIYDPTVKFSFCNEEGYYVQITIMKE